MCVKYKAVKFLYIFCQSADPSPPLSTILGNIGVNTASFSKNFNEYTKDLPLYFLLKVQIFIHTNNSVAFKTFLPSTGHLLNLLKFKKKIKIKKFDRIHEQIIECIDLYSFFKLAKLKFPLMDLKQACLILSGSLKSKNLVIVRK